VKKGNTKDELFLIKLYQMASMLGDPFQEIDRYLVGTSMGQNPKGIDNIVRMLAQTNFLKKGEGDAIYLTPQGEKLVHALLT